MTQKHIPIFYEGQDDLVDILATSMVSICYNTKSFIDFYILDCGLCDFNKRQLESLKEKFNNFSIEFIPVDLKQFEGLRGYTEGNFVDCYSRLLIPELKPELDRAIYLDTDTIALKDIKELWDSDLDGNSIGAVLDLGLTDFARNNFLVKLHGNPKQPYLSGGVFILDCKKWRQNNITKDLLDLAQKEKENILVIIEDIFSLYFTSDYKLLPCRYAMIDAAFQFHKMPVDFANEDYMENEWRHIAIMHFAGASKVWKTYYNVCTQRPIKHYNDFYFFAEMTPFYTGLKAKYLENFLNFC